MSRGRLSEILVVGGGGRWAESSVEGEGRNHSHPQRPSPPHTAPLSPLHGSSISSSVENMSPHPPRASSFFPVSSLLPLLVSDSALLEPALEDIICQSHIHPGVTSVSFIVTQIECALYKSRLYMHFLL